MQAFIPSVASTVNIDISGSSQRVLVSGSVTTQVRVMNNGSATVWINPGDSTVTAATTTGMPVGPGVTEILTLFSSDGGPIYIAGIAAGSTGKIYFTPGAGI